MTLNHVILVDESDNQFGTMDKMDAHRQALLHRAISVFIFNSKGEWLLQQRAKNKYHSNSLWTNTSCTHPYPNESIDQAAHRRLMEEMGMQCPLTWKFSFVYKEQLDNELTEFEFDHVFFGFSDKLPEINEEEVWNYKYLNYVDLQKDVELNPDNYTVWFKKITAQVYQHLQPATSKK